ncbi:hypothetical protein [Sphingobacterium thalpophilum]|uniref:hypothetical protein n=1 Tax=Sphingobacterium thalpophilum TaxID=259 RepID=UPI002D78DAF6|nr:hypothetical protein [Sphingobacterium thalpophilum]
MLKAAALYLVLVISLIVSVLLGSLIYLAFFYRDQEARFSRKEMLRQQAEAGFVLASSRDFPHVQDTALTNVLQQGDSVYVSKFKWGLYDIAVVRARMQQDSVMKNALLGAAPADSTVLYITDEDRPLSVSGETVIKGTAFLPKSGVRPSYVDGEYFKGNEKIVEGQSKDSDRQMPTLDSDRLSYVQSLVKGDSTIVNLLPSGTTTGNPFHLPTARYRLISGQTELRDSLLGNVQLIADSTITIPANTVLQDVIVIAPCIRIEKGFSGAAQFFARDSLILEDNVSLLYPSTVAVIGNEGKSMSMRVGNSCKILGTVLLYEPKRSDMPSLASFGKDCLIQGDLIVYGLLDYSKGMQVHGRTACYRFLYKSPSSMYENFLVNIKFDRSRLSPHFLHSPLVLPDRKKLVNKPLKWYAYGS